MEKSLVKNFATILENEMMAMIVTIVTSMAIQKMIVFFEKMNRQRLTLFDKIRSFSPRVNDRCFESL